MRPYRPKRISASRASKRPLSITELAFPRDLLVDLTFDPAETRDKAGRWFHGTNAVLNVGDFIEPASKTGAKNWAEQMGLDATDPKIIGPHYSRDRIYLTSDRIKAMDFGNYVYEVEPMAPVDVDPESMGEPWFRSSGAARVVRKVIDHNRAVDLTFHADQPRDPHTGRWVQTPMSLAKAAVAGGFTLHVKDMSAVKHGVVVARPGTTLLDANDTHTAALAITKFLTDHPDAEHIGGWYNSEDHKVYLDVVDILHDREAAVRLGMRRNQIAIFDLDTMTEIPTGGTGHDRPEAGADLSTRELGRDDPGREVPVVLGGGSEVGRPGEVDLAHPSIRRTRRITSQLLNGEDPVDLLTQRGTYRPVAEAVAKMASQGTAHRPNARLGGDPLTLGIRLERDREALYRGGYMLKAADRIETSIEEGDSLAEAVAKESRFHQMHEEARRNRLDAVTRAQRIASQFGQPEGNRTLVGWYLNPLLNNDPECEAANGHNFYAEEGTLIGFPGAVHLNCGCVTGPPIEGAGMVNDAVRGVVPITHISSRPKFAAKRRTRMSA